MSPRSARAALSSMLLLALACDGPRPPVDEDAGGGRDSGGGCTDTCETLGETRCGGTVIEGCAIGADGCQSWRAGLDCAASGSVCDDAAEPAVCSSGAGTCTDGARNQDETDVDCGGTRCDACEISEGCARAADCDSRNCDTVSMTCVTPGTPTCTDGARNQDETDVYCGGAICGGCGVGAMCAAPGDCRSGLCGDDGRCEGAPGTCTDGMENQDETDVDCGGEVCDPCGIGERCTAGSDCTTGNCDGGTCAGVSASCTDGAQNGTETDVDCGGSSCDPCADGLDCGAPSDCTSGYCNRGECVPLGTCADGARNGEETDVDCGGPTCAECPNGRGCLAGGDCRSGSCETGAGLCVNPGGPTCTDGMQNRDETDVDCGGLYCARCMLGETCADASDCVSGACDLSRTPHACIGTTPSYTVDEDFETGDFTLFPYTFAHTGGAMDWSIEDAAGACHAGSYCMRSNVTHPSSTTSSVELSLSVRENTTITFWVKTQLEPNEHYFRFYVDGVMQREITGVNGWTMVSVPVTATGAGGLNRVLRWETVRSAFVSPDHTPWYEVWVDDIDMPAWNTEPTVPELVRPTNGQLTTDTTPTFAWRSFDADFDTITYEMQWDSAPTFTVDPQTTGETNDLTHTPATALPDGRYYWRVRAKDNSNYRWSDWSPVYALTVEAGHEYGAIWRQTVREHFEMNEVGGLSIGATSVTTGATSYDQSRGPSAFAFNGGTATHTFNSTPATASGQTATLTITAHGDFDGGSSASENATVSIDGTSVATFSPSTCSAAARTFSVSDVGRFVNDGAANITFTTGSGVDSNGCSTASSNQWTARLQYTALNQGTMTSIPIRFSTFEGRTFWEKVHVVGTGTIRIQVLDESGALIPDTIIPGNAAGNTSRTVHLWYLDPMVHPVIRLRAMFEPGAVLEEWSVVGNDVFEWTFSHDGDTEGWIAEDYMATPTVTVAGGVLRVASTAAGSDPRIVYAIPRDGSMPTSGLDSRRFTRLLVRVRTSNNYTNDDVTAMWSSNFGGIDTRRSFTESGVFLVGFQDVEIDLTQTATPPNEAWQGTIYSLRLDPVVRFLDETDSPADGWFEIERIALY